MCPDHAAVGNDRSFQDGAPRADPDIVSDADRRTDRRLDGHRPICGGAVIVVPDGTEFRDHDVVADGYLFLDSEIGVSGDQDAITDRQFSASADVDDRAHAQFYLVPHFQDPVHVVSERSESIGGKSFPPDDIGRIFEQLVPDMGLDEKSLSQAVDMRFKFMMIRSLKR